MNEHERLTLNLLVFLLLLTCACLVYLDWRKQGEIDFLHSRIDSINGLHGREYVARILRAHDDATAERIASGEET